MKICFYSDAHGNLEALETLLSQSEVRKADRTIFVGDLVGYGANPNEVIERIREIKSVAVMGNHDYATVTGDTHWFNPRAAAAIHWTREVISEENLEYLKSLPKRFLGGLDEVRVGVFHGSPRDPISEYVYAHGNDWLFRYYLEDLGVNALVLGHTHIPYLVKLGDKGVALNPGGLGQPRDGDPRLSYAILDTTTLRVDFHRVEYDVSKTAKKILEAGLPEFLAKRLFLGI
ncbi:MAG: metallophosphoesterase family protein [Candidatus Geothermarchaeales archaeon]